MNIESLLIETGINRDKPRHLISKSTVVSQEMVEFVVRWMPAVSEMIGSVEQTSCFPIGDKLIAICRHLVIGKGSENLRPKVISRVAVCDVQQMISRKYHPVSLQKVLSSSGMLNVTDRGVHGVLETEQVTSASTYCSLTIDSNRNLGRLVDKVDCAVDIHGQVVLFGLKNPLLFMSMLSSHSQTKRGSNPLSFATGRRISFDTPFQVHFFESKTSTVTGDIAERQLRAFVFEESHIQSLDSFDALVDQRVLV